MIVLDNVIYTGLGERRMLENYDYINLLCSDCDMMKRIETLFLSNDQQKRFEHICSVAKRIDGIAVQYGLNREKCRISAMLHDISTLIKWEDMLVFAKENGWKLCDAEISHPFLLHQRISEVVARDDFGIIDEDVLEAIAFHTSLCENASKYQMALFIADKLDWSLGGYPPYYEQMTQALNISLEMACYEYVKYMQDEGNMQSIHSDFAKAVDWLEKEMSP